MKTEKYEAVDAIAEVCRVDRIDVTAALALMTGETCTISQARDIANLYANKKTYLITEQIEKIKNLSHRINKVDNDDFYALCEINTICKDILGTRYEDA